MSQPVASEHHRPDSDPRRQPHATCDTRHGSLTPQEEVEARLAAARANVVRARTLIRESWGSYATATTASEGTRTAYYEACSALEDAENALALARGEAHIAGVMPRVLHALQH